jgi:hypothetical protein
MWPDKETKDDLIGFRVHAELIRAVITDPSMLPATIGVFGDWGGGKTSIMKMLEASLDSESYSEGSQERTACASIAVVYANTWQFEGYDDAKSAIISSILLELAAHKTFGTKVKEKAVGLLKRVNWMRFAKLTLKHVAVPAAAAFFSGGVAAIPAAVAVASGLSKLKGGEAAEESKDSEAPQLDELLKEDAEAGTMDIKDFRDQFEEMLRIAGIKILVVLVDDLDRCTPERIIENLEAVKLFLSAEQTAFVIGADRRIVEHAIREKYAHRSADYNDKDQEDKLVRDYLEKLVQIPYTLPRLSATEIHTYMTLLFCKHHLGVSDFNACVAACEGNRSANRYGSFGYVEVRKALKNITLSEPLSEALTFSASASPLIADGLKGNPRQVKRFLNALLLRKKLAQVARLENIRDAVLIKLMILEYTNNDLFTTLFNWQAQQRGHPAQLKELEDAVDEKNEKSLDDAAAKLGGKWTSVDTKRWVQMEPMLQGVDLRDYFWVARDRLESTFAGVVMLPPVVKAVLDGLLSTLPPKRNASLQLAKNLSTEERQLLVQAIDDNIIRQPELTVGYDALIHLVENELAEAATKLSEILSARPLTKVPASVGIALGRLFTGKPQFQSTLAPAVDALKKDPKSHAGKGFSESSAAKKK